MLTKTQPISMLQIIFRLIQALAWPIVRRGSRMRLYLDGK